MSVGSDDESILGAGFGEVVLDSGVSVPLTNAMLREIFERTLGPEPENSPYRDYAIDAALAVRLLQLGAPAVVLEIGSFDFHSGERTEGPGLYRFFGRLWATLEWLLSRARMPETGAPMLDRTLVATMSDFGRDSIAGGWNPAEGTDHGSDQACYYLAHALMGAGVVPGRLIGGVDTTTYAPGAGRVFSPRQLLSTMLWALGLDATGERWGLPDVSPITELWA